MSKRDEWIDPYAERIRKEQAELNAKEIDKALEKHRKEIQRMYDDAEEKARNAYEDDNCADGDYKSKQGWAKSLSSSCPNDYFMYKYENIPSWFYDSKDYNKLQKCLSSTDYEYKRLDELEKLGYDYDNNEEYREICDRLNKAEAIGFRHNKMMNKATLNRNIVTDTNIKRKKENFNISIELALSLLPFIFIGGIIIYGILKAYFIK